LKRFLLISNKSTTLVDFRLDLIKEIQKFGIAVHVAAPGLVEGSKDVITLRKFDVVVHQIPLDRTALNPLKDGLLLFSLIRLILSVQPHYLLSYTIKPVIWASIAARFSNVPVTCSLITGLGYSFSEGNGSFTKRMLLNLSKIIYRVALKRNATVFFQNPDDELFFREANIISNKVRSVVLKGSGVNLLEYRAVSLPDEPIFLMVCRLLADKGVREFVAAAELVKIRHPNAIFRLAGPLDENPESISQSELNSWVEKKAIEYLGVLDDVRPALSEASVFVLPSYREGTPRSTLEALSMGRPIISTDVPGCRETVTNSENGLLVKVKSVKELAVAMERLVSDSALRARMGQASLRLARDEFDVNKVNKIMLRSMGFIYETSGTLP
jgi:glycosyltransferase involved in cell wall biosynthesis